jgi:hypothetical protein
MSLLRQTQPRSGTGDENKMSFMWEGDVAAGTRTPLKARQMPLSYRRSQQEIVQQTQVQGMRSKFSRKIFERAHTFSTLALKKGQEMMARRTVVQRVCWYSPASMSK